MLQSTPDQIIASSKPVDDVAFCIADKNQASAFRQSDGSQIIQVKSLVGVVGVVFVVKPEGSGSVLEIRRANSPVSLDKYKRCV